MKKERKKNLRLNSKGILLVFRQMYSENQDGNLLILGSEKLEKYITFWNQTSF